MIEDIKLVPIILTIIVLLAILEVFVKPAKLEEIRRLIVEKHFEVIKSLNGVQVLRFTSSNEAYEFMSKKIIESKELIYHCALGQAVPLAKVPNNSFEKAIQKALKQNKLRYNYIAKIPDERRVKRIKALLSDKSIQTFYPKCVEIDFDGLYNFMVFDNDTVIINFPYEYGNDEKFVFIKHPEIVQFYKSYFNHIWKLATPYDNS
ncbi:hypothetical protein [Mucilaginibacter phyllosphaerae]